jgi:hypothetical protein
LRIVLPLQLSLLPPDMFLRLEITWDEKTKKIKIPVNSKGVKAVFAIHVPSDFPFGRLKASINYAEDDIDLQQGDKLEDIEKFLAKKSKSSNTSIADLVEEFVTCFGTAFGIQASKVKLTQSKQGWRTQSVDASNIREVHMTVEDPLQVDFKEAMFIYGGKTINALPGASNARIIFAVWPFTAKL